MADVVTSEPLDYNVSSSANATTTETGTRSLTGFGMPRSPIIVRVVIFLIMAIFNLGGNGFTLITIRLTPRLWTKTNYILASMLVSDIMIGLFVFWYTPLLLVAYVYNNPCQYNVVITATTPLQKMNGYVSIYHLILISVERCIAIVYPHHYETKFTDRTLKCAISAAWATGILVGMTWLVWLINADLNKCDLVPGQFYLLEVVIYIPACIVMFICYGNIFVISWRQRRRIEPSNVISVAVSAHKGSSTALTQRQSSNTDLTKYTKHREPAAVGAHGMPAVNSDTASAEMAQQQQQIKSRRREFKAVYLTAAIVGTFVILWFPSMVGRMLMSVGYNPVVVNNLYMASGPIGAFNYASTWVIYAAVSRRYRRAYRQVLIRIGCCCCKNFRLQADNSVMA